jgi:hypothetical protein
VLLGAVWIRDLVILVVRGDNIQENSTTFKYIDLAATLILISKGRNATVGVDLEEPGFFLFVRTEVQGYDLDEMLLVVGVKRAILLAIPCIRDQAPPRRERP